MKILAIWLGKIAKFATRILNFGGGTTFPGLLAEKIDPKITRKLSAKLRYGAIVITGTNGKTTVSKMLAEILTEEGYRVLCNPSGSNLSRGVATALIDSAGLFGNGLDADIAIFEVDEATMPEVMTKVRPRAVLVTNLFRDQLDRYGELDKTADIIGRSLRGFSKMTTILNADDPLVASLAEYAEGEVKYFGLNDPQIKTTSKAAMDSKDCTNCGHELSYQNRYFGHLGTWKCPNCSLARPKPEFWANNVEVTPSGSKFDLSVAGEKLPVSMGISGLYNVYNAIAAAAAADVLDSGGAPIVAALRNFSAAFGRMERLKIGPKEAMLLLVKNPTGANQAFEAVYSDGKPKKVLFALNDNFADGTDISWIWDIDFENLNLKGSHFIATGIRAEEVALRLKYAGVKEEAIEVLKETTVATEKLMGLITEQETGYIFTTYTAMMEIRSDFIDKKDDLSGLGRVTKHGI